MRRTAFRCSAAAAVLAAGVSATVLVGCAGIWRPRERLADKPGRKHLTDVRTPGLLQPEEIRWAQTADPEGGESWSEIMNGLPRDLEYYSLILHPRDARTLYVSSSFDGVWMRRGAGESWTRINEGLANLQAGAANNVATNLVLDAAGEHLYFGTMGSGVWRARVMPLGVAAQGGQQARRGVAAYPIASPRRTRSDCVG